MTPRVQTVAVKTNDGNGVNYRGVMKLSCGRYGVRIRDPFKKARVWVGTFDTPEEAARGYDKRAIEFRGAKAKTNFPYHNNNESLSQTRSTVDSSLPDLNLSSDSISSRFPFPTTQGRSEMMVFDDSSESESSSSVVDTSTEEGVRRVVFDLNLNCPPPPEASLPDLNLAADSISSRFPFQKIQVKSGMMVFDDRSESKSLSVLMDTSTEGGRRVVFDFDLNLAPPPEN